MASNDDIKSGSPGMYQDDRGGGVVYPHPVIGIVKDNIDEKHNGRIRVFLTNYGAGDPNDANSWVTVSYMSPWFGLTQPTSAPDADGAYLTNAQSYGFWATAPDIGTQVVCIFIDGKPNQGYYIGGLPPMGQHFMTPAIGAASSVIPNGGEATTYGGADRLPVTEININNEKYKNSTNQTADPKPIHSYQALTLFNQGLIRDNVRGVIGSTSMRETPSAVFGISTPGAPIWDGGYTRQNIKAAIKGANNSKLKIVGRTGGHSLVMDDGELLSGKDQMIRLRSAGGHQITMSDDAQVLFITHSNGKSWIELGPEGTVDIFSTNSFNVRTQGDINFHADRDINIHAKRNFNVNAENVNQQSVKNYSVRAGADSAFQTVGAHTHKAGGALSLGAGGDASLAGGTAFINGGKVNLNTGQTGTAPKEVPAAVLTSHVETQFSQSKGWMYPAQTPTMSITNRLPTHQPWALAGKGVDAETSPTAAATDAPAPPVAAATAAAASTPPAQMTSPENAQTVPSQPTESGAPLPATTKQAMISQNAVSAAAMSAAEKAAGGVIPGVAGLNLPQLDLAGILKTGASVAVGALMAKGIPFSSAVSDNSFTGAMGVTNAAKLTENPIVQASIANKSIDNAGIAMIDAGVITGNESPTEIAGLINAAALTSPGQVADQLVANANAPAPTTPTATSSTSNATAISGSNGIAKLGATVGAAIAAGNFAGQLADKLLSGGGSLSTSISDLKGKLTNLGGSITAGIDSLKGKITGLLSSNPLDALKSSAQQAFAAAEASFTNLKAGFPNPLGGAQAPAPDSPQQMAANDYDAAKAEKEEATVALFSAKKDYYDNKTPENLAKVQELEAKIAAANKKITAASAAFLGLSGTPSVSSLTASASGLLGNAVGKLSSAASSSSLVGGITGKLGISLPSTQLLSAESLQAQATSIQSGFSSIATTLNSGANALPGGLSSMVAEGKSSASGIIGGITSSLPTSLSGLAGGVPNIAGSLSNLSGSLPNVAGGLSGLAGGLPTASLNISGVGNLLSAAKSLGGNASIAIGTAVDSLTSGVVPPTAATDTFKAVDLTAKMGAVLGDSRIPLPNLKAMPPSTATTPAEVDTALAAKEKALKDLQLEEKVLDLFKQKYGADAATSETAAYLLKKQGDKVAMLREAYNRIISQA